MKRAIAGAAVGAALYGAYRLGVGEGERSMLRLGEHFRNGWTIEDVMAKYQIKILEREREFEANGHSAARAHIHGLASLCGLIANKVADAVAGLHDGPQTKELIKAAGVLHDLSEREGVA